MVVYVRHGATMLNKGGTDERLRGWLPLGLSAQGIIQAKQIARRLPMTSDPTTFTTSDLPRAMQTAALIGRQLNLEPTADSRLRDWNTGTLAGQKVTDVMPWLKQLIAHPDEPAPEGEPLNAYLQRFVPAMREKVAAPGWHLVVGHARGSSILEGIASPNGGQGQAIDPAALSNRPHLQPGGLMVINPQWDLTIQNPE